MIACYCRVSSARQKTDSQKPEIRRWLQGNGIDPSTVEWFEDKETGRQGVTKPEDMEAGRLERRVRKTTVARPIAGNGPPVPEQRRGRLWMRPKAVRSFS